MSDMEKLENELFPPQEEQFTMGTNLPKTLDQLKFCKLH